MSGPQQPRPVVIGTAGHIDHGKTNLIRALTGIDTDRLPEEKRRGITIDLGFAAMETTAPDGSPLRISFIDVPGHARFVRNMLAGTGGIDAVLLVISAEEGVKPQTEEHLSICELLGIRHGITVLTKSDLVSEDRLRDVTTTVKEFLDSSFLRDAPLMAVSAHSGVGIPGLRNSLAHLAHHVPQRSVDQVVRMPVDRSFVIKGFGTVATGTLVGGTVAQGDRLAVEPGGRSVKVRRIQTHGRSEERVSAGSRAALNLSGVETSEIGRGHTLVAPDLVKAVACIDVEVRVLDGMPELKHRARMHFHAFASECMAAVTLYNAAAIGPGTAGLARLRLSEPIVLLPGDRFVLRRGSPAMTIGGGRVLDAHPRLELRKAKTAERLQTLRAASREEWVWLRIARRGMSTIDLRQLSTETGLLEAALAEIVQAWIGDGRLNKIEDRWLITRESLGEAKRLIQTALGGVGSKRAQLLERTGLKQNVFDFALQRLVRESQLRSDGEMVLPFHSAPKPDPEQSRLHAIRVAFEQGGLTPPSPADLSMRLGITADEMRRLVTDLLREKVLVRLGSDSLCADRKALDDLARRVRPLRGTRMDVAAFKQFAGVSRKYAIPLLEYLDREHVTRKEGDHRLVL